AFACLERARRDPQEALAYAQGGGPAFEQHVAAHAARIATAGGAPGLGTDHPEGPAIPVLDGVGPVGIQHVTLEQDGVGDRLGAPEHGQDSLVGGWAGARASTACGVACAAARPLNSRKNASSAVRSSPPPSKPRNIRRTSPVKR